MTASALFVSPHPDDVALSLGGIASRLVAERGPALQLTAFAAAPPPSTALSETALKLHQMWGAGSVEELWARRRDEDRRAAAELGLALECLPFCDAIYRGYTLETLGGTIAPTDDGLAAQLAACVIARWRAVGCPEVYLPLALAHVDHRLCCGLAPKLRQEGASVWLYEDFPYALKGPELVAKRLSEIALPLEERLIDVSAWFARRVAAVACYASQLELVFRKLGPFSAVAEAHARSLAGGGGALVERVWRVL